MIKKLLQNCWDWIFQACKDSTRGMQNIRTLDEDENRSKEGLGFHGAWLARFQQHWDQPMGKVKLMCSFGGKTLYTKSTVTILARQQSMLSNNPRSNMKSTIYMFLS